MAGGASIAPVATSRAKGFAFGGFRGGAGDGVGAGGAEVCAAVGSTWVRLVVARSGDGE